MRGLNLGCGERFHPDWTNLDVAPARPRVQAYDLSRGIPLPDATFDVVYLSHVLEHFGKKEALGLLKECHRVLQRGGIVRVAVPDLEHIAQLYLQALGKAADGANGWQAHYDWMMLELYDQTVRECSGGEMLEYFRQDPIPNEAFVYERLGGEARRMRYGASGQNSLRERRSALASARFRLGQLRFGLRAKLLKLLLGKKDYRALELGRFRMGGEIHKWMYDRFSLARILQQAGFARPRAVGPAESRIPNWAGFHLDTEPDGSVYKPDSLFMEATKP